VDDAGVTLIDGVAAAGHGVAHAGALQGAAAPDHLVLAAVPAHHAPLRPRALVVVVTVPVVCGREERPPRFYVSVCGRED